MAKKYQRRTHVAVRKKQEEEKKLAKRRAFYREHKKQLIIAAIAAVLLIVAIVLAVDYFYAPGGSMRIFMGNLLGVQENSVIRNLGTTRSPRYYTFGTFDAPEGYTSDPSFYQASDTKEQNFYYVADDENAVIENIYVTGVKNRTGESMVEEVGGSGMYAFMSEKRTAEIAGNTYNYLYALSNNSDDDSIFWATLIMYVDTVQDSSILVNLSSPRGAENEVPDEGTMLQAAEPILAGVKVPATGK